MKAILFMCATLLHLLTHTAVSAETDQVKLLDRLEKVVKGQSIPEIHEQMLKGLPWVKISSDVGDGDARLAKRKSDLFDALKEKILLYSTRKKTPGNPGQISGIVILLDLEAVVKKAGGYKNKVLSVSLSRLAAWEMARLAITRPGELEQISTVLQKRNNSTSFQPLKTIADYMGEDKAFHGEQEKLGKILSSEKIQQSINSGIYTFYEDLAKVLPKDLAPNDWLNSSGIYDRANVYKLLAFEARSELVLRSTLPCLIKYLEKKGEISKLNPYDVTEFNRVLADDRWKYRFPFLQVRKPDPASLHRLAQEVSQDCPTNRFLRNIGMK